MAGDIKGGSYMKRKPSGPAGSSSRPASKRTRLAGHGEEKTGGFDSEAPNDLAYHLPAEIWHRVFTLLPPKTLGRLLTVNKLFRTYLDPSSPAEIKGPSTPYPILPPMKPDAIWQASRRAFWPHMPGPLKDKSEVDMWRLCCSRTCQFCNSRDRSVAGKTPDQWNRGPGAKGVSPVFPFFIVSCGKCLSNNMVKEVDVLLSPSTPSFLLAGLPMVFVTPELHVIPPQVLSSGTGPLQTQVEKGFYSAQIQDINAEFEAVKALGYAAAGEWTKGLEARGKRSLADASRWERWYLSGGVHDMRTSRQSLQAPPLKDEAASSSLFRDMIGFPQLGENHSPAARPTGGNKDWTKMRAEATDMHPGSRPRPCGQQRLTEGEATELKAKRKAEIERRALLLEPPMTPSVLAHAPSFQAAVQITTPLDDRAWEILKPRLLDHREAAGQRERESIANAKARQAVAKAARSSSPVAQPDQPEKKVTDKDWDEAQGPLRAKISDFADEIIRDAWNNGKKVSKKEASQFAVDVLLFVRARFYANVAEEAAAARAAGRKPIADPPEGPWTRKLTLENLKWVFDMKIKPYTDRYRKELFFCSGCDGNRKAFGLESAIQHYAAKHTAVLSVGNVVVHWRAEWPESPIFDPDPKQKRLRQLGGTANTPSVGPQPSYGHNGFNALPPASYPPYGTPHQPYDYATQAPNTLPTPYPAGVVPPTGYAGSYPPQQHPPHAPAYPLYPQWPQYAAPFHTGQPNTAHAEGRGVPSNGSASAPRQAERAAPAATPAPSATISQHTDQLRFMTEVVEEVWKEISHVKDLPDDAKALIFIHHVTTRFEQQFREATPLDTFFNAISNRKVVASARILKDLRCKTCMLRDENGHKGRTFHALVQHFVAKHSQQSGLGLYKDWRVDMVCDPAMEIVPTFRKGFGNHKESLALVAEALPQAFAVKPSGGLIAYKQQGSRGKESPREKVKVSDGDNRRDSSSSDSYEPEPNPEDITVKPESPEPRGAPAAAPAANGNGGRHNPVVLDLVDRPALQPASVVYGRPDTPRKPLREQDSSRRDGHRTPRTTQPALRPEGVGMRRAAAPVAPAQQADGGFEMLERLESHLDSQHGAPARSEPTRREMHQDLGPRDYLPRDHTPRNAYAVAREYPAGRYHEPAPHMLARPEGYPHGWYDGRSPRPAYPPASYRQGGGYVAYRSYPDELPAGPAQPAELYELVEVRDPRGDYFIKLPIRRDPGALYPPEARGMEPYPRHGPVYAHEREARQPTVYEDYRQPPPAHAPQRPPSAMDYEEYDPRYPASGGGSASAAPREPLFQEYRH